MQSTKPVIHHGKVFGGAKRIRKFLLPTSKLLTGVKNPRGQTLRNIHPGKYQTLEGKLYTRQVYEKGKPTKKYVATYDAFEGKSFPGKDGKREYARPSHYPEHARWEIFLHEHGVKRREFSAMSYLEEVGFLLPNEKFGVVKEITPVSPEVFELLFDRKLSNEKDPKKFQEELNRLVRVMQYSIQGHYQSHRAFYRTVARMIKDPKIQPAIQQLDRIPTKNNRQTNFRFRISPSYRKSLRAITDVYRYIWEQKRN